MSYVVSPQLVHKASRTIADAFAAHGWVWGGPGAEYVPSPCQVERALRELLACAPRVHDIVSCGRIVVHHGEGGIVRVMLAAVELDVTPIDNLEEVARP